MEVLVTGATGYVGSAVADRLTQLGHRVIALARSDESRRFLTERGYRVLDGDARDAERLAKHASAFDATVHAAHTQGSDNADVDAALARAVARATKAAGKRFVYTSGIWNFRSTGERVVDEAAPTDPLPIVAWRGPVEREVLESGGVVVRPGVVYGRGGGLQGIAGLLVREARRDGRVRYVGDGAQEWPLVHVDDLADLYARALVAPQGAILHGVGNGVATMRDVALAASFAGGAPGRIEAWPIESARSALGDFADALAASQRVSSARTRALTGWTPRGPSIFEELLAGSYAQVPIRAVV